MHNIYIKIIGTKVIFVPSTTFKGDRDIEHMQVVIFPCSSENIKVPSKTTTNAIRRLTHQLIEVQENYFLNNF